MILLILQIPKICHFLLWINIHCENTINRDILTDTLKPLDLEYISFRHCVEFDVIRECDKNN